jgi:hypothetical protein
VNRFYFTGRDSTPPPSRTGRLGVIAVVYPKSAGCLPGAAEGTFRSGSAPQAAGAPSETGAGGQLHGSAGTGYGREEFSPSRVVVRAGGGPVKPSGSSMNGARYLRMESYLRFPLEAEKPSVGRGGYAPPPPRRVENKAYWTQMNTDKNG